MNRTEHVAWCKEQAIKQLHYTLKETGGDVRAACAAAFAGMASDLRKHDETADHIGIEMGMMLLLSGQREAHDVDAMIKFINGFN